MVAHLQQHEEDPSVKQYCDALTALTRVGFAIGIGGVAVFLLLEKTGLLALIAQYAMGMRH